MLRYPVKHIFICIEQFLSKHCRFWFSCTAAAATVLNITHSFSYILGMKSHSIESSFCFNLTVVSNVFVFTLLPSTLTHVQNTALSHFLSRVLVSVCIPSSVVKLCSNGCQAMDPFPCSPGSLRLQRLTFPQLSLLVDTPPQ